jgi:hypothetical protein
MDKAIRVPRQTETAKFRNYICFFSSVSESAFVVRVEENFAYFQSKREKSYKIIQIRRYSLSWDYKIILTLP